MAKARKSSGGIIALALIVIVAVGGWLFWSRKTEKGPEFYTSAVGRGELVQSVTATGTIKPLLDSLVSSQVSGYIKQIFADFNDKVKAHQVLANLDPSFYQAQLLSAEGDLENAKAANSLQRINVARDKELLDKHLISQSDFDTASALLAESSAQVKIKEAAVASARTNLSYTTIYSPIDGVVITRNVDVGNTVAASLSAPTLFEIGNDLTQMQIDTAVAEADIGNVSVNQDVNFTVDAYPNQEFHGTVYQVRIAPLTQQNVVIYDVMIKVPNPELKLKPGMTANVSIIVARRPSALKIANSALRFRMPEGMAFTPAVEPPKPAAAPGGAAPAAEPKKLSSDERRKAMRQIMQDVGWSPQSGPPTPEIAARILALAKERGVELPDRMLQSLKGGGRSDAPVVRTVYVLPPGNPQPIPKAVKVKLGITDGTSTEVLSGLEEGDVVITGTNLPANPSQPAGSPFGGGGMRRF